MELTESNSLTLIIWLVATMRCAEVFKGHRKEGREPCKMLSVVFALLRASATLPFLTSSLTMNRIPKIELSADDLKCPDKRRELSAFYFRTFNRTVFSDKLPPNLAVHWNKRLLTTAGRCLQATIGDHRVAFIHLSNKICDTTERVRDTLLHEMCHAATWVLDGVQHTDHGENFQFWAERAHRTHPDLPPINSFHTYIIRKKFNYRCTRCTNRVGRHTDSLDTKRQVCGLCGSRFQLMKESGDSKNTSKTTVHEPSAKGDSFARYVRENIRRVKQRNKKLSKQGIMRKLSREFDKIHGR